MSRITGKQSMTFEQAPLIAGAASVVGKKESEGPLGGAFDVENQDDLFGTDSWEKAESELQRQALQTLLEKTGCPAERVRMLFGGDLLGQLIATSFGLAEFQIPLLGLYGACSTCGEALLLAAMTVAGGYAGAAAAVTSSHFGSAEKQFRFPLAYGNQRPLSATWTVTGSAAFLVAAQEEKICERLVAQAESVGVKFAAQKGLAHAKFTGSPERNHAEGTPQEKKASAEIGESSGKFQAGQRQQEDRALAKITGATVGKIVDLGVKDSMNMGACMAPAAADTICRNLEDFGRKPEDYDRIITGDLGTVGREILLELLKEKGLEVESRHLDCGLLIYDGERQDTHAGGSGCGCSAVVLAAEILPRLRTGEWRRVLFVPTGALLSSVSFNEGQSVPGIAHGVVLETI